MAETQWEWPMADCQENHRERVALLRSIPYEAMVPVEGGKVGAGVGKALSLNISSGGMLVLMEQAPIVDQVLRVRVPTPVSVAETPTLAEVRWTRELPFGRATGNKAFLVGLKFVF